MGLHGFWSRVQSGACMHLLEGVHCWEGAAAWPRAHAWVSEPCPERRMRACSSMSAPAVGVHESCPSSSSREGTARGAVEQRMRVVPLVAGAAVCLASHACIYIHACMQEGQPCHAIPRHLPAKGCSRWRQRTPTRPPNCSVLAWAAAAPLPSARLCALTCAPWATCARVRARVGACTSQPRAAALPCGLRGLCVCWQAAQKCAVHQAQAKHSEDDGREG